MKTLCNNNFYNYSGEYVIFGAGGFAHELWGWIRSSKDLGAPKKLIAFIDDNPDSHGFYDGVPIVGRAINESDVGRPYLLAIGSPTARRSVVEGLDDSKWHPLTYIHESVVSGINVSIGKGVVICPRVSLSSDCTIHDYALVNGGCGIAHDVVVGEYTTLLGCVSVNGNVHLGADVTIGAGALIHPGRRIGNRAVVGMGSAVFSHVKPGITVIGNPARPFSI